LKKYSTLIIFLCLQSFLFSQDQFWVVFKDKKQSIYSLQHPEDFLSQNALNRRYFFDLPITPSDLPISMFYVNEVINLGANSLKDSKWLNGVLFSSNNPNFFKEVKNLAFVASIQKIEQTQTKQVKQKFDYNPITKLCDDGYPIYGCAYTPISMLQGEFLHHLGHKGNTIDIAVMDNGFQFVNTNRFFDSLILQNKIHGGYNFVNDDPNVFSEGDHGAYVMSTLAANIKDTLLGTAPLGNYYLFTTEDNNAEGLPEEINWAMAAEWADSALGTWVVLTTSLGYSQGFNDPSTNHSYADMDGNTTIITKAADLAAQKGMLVVNSAGNEGEDPWKYIIAPADGDSVLAIGAIDPEGWPAAFSSYGPSLDGRVKPNISAQGVGVIAAKYDGTLQKINGTSFSGPIVAGLAACLWEAFPTKSNMELFKAIEQSAHLFYAPEEQYGYGIPNFYRAYEILKLNASSAQQNLLVFPNPVEELLNIYFLTESTGAYQFLISDMQGKIWLEEAAKKNVYQHVLQVKELPKGVYSIFVRQEKEKYESKFIKR
jgi:serine protease AprX